MKKLTVLVPSAGHPTRPSLLKCLRNNGERDVSIIGVDMDDSGLAPHIVDKFYRVPPRKETGYLDTILDICEWNNVDVYYALGEEEAIASAVRKPEFDAIGVSVISPGSFQMLSIATEKCRWHDFLKEHGIRHARYRNIYKPEDIEPAITELGYPEEDVFVKPSGGRGGRGARVITARNTGRNASAERQGEPTMSMEAFRDLLAPLEPGEFTPWLAMEYLPGTYYSVDVLSRDGTPYYVIPKIRLQGSASNTTTGMVDLNPDPIELASEICRAFDFSFLQNYEMKLNKDGEAIVYDINPRGGASLALCSAAGANIAYFAVKMAAGEEIPRVEIKDKVKMIRFYDEYFL